MELPESDKEYFQIVRKQGPCYQNCQHLLCGIQQKVQNRKVSNSSQMIHKKKINMLQMRIPVEARCSVYFLLHLAKTSLDT